jgi:colicin import membrane protein
MMKLTPSLILIALFSAACGTAPVADPEPTVVPSRSVAQANTHIVEAAAEKARIEAEFRAQEQICYKRFFTNNCLDLANEERRIALAGVKARDNEAQHFLRQNALDVRDAEIAQNEAEFAKKEADLAVMPPRVAPQVKPLPPPKPSTIAARKARQAEREQAAVAREAANAGKRADKVAAFEKRQADAARRQQEVTQRQAARAKKAADKAASDAAAAATAATAATAAKQAAEAKQ